MNATQCRVCTLPKHNMETTISAINRSAKVCSDSPRFVCLFIGCNSLPPTRIAVTPHISWSTHWCKHVPSSSNSTKKGIKYKKKIIYIYIPEKKPDLRIGYSHEMTCTQSEAVRRGFFFAFSEWRSRLHSDAHETLSATCMAAQRLTWRKVDFQSWQNFCMRQETSARCLQIHSLPFGQVCMRCRSRHHNMPSLPMQANNGFLCWFPNVSCTSFQNLLTCGLDILIRTFGRWWGRGRADSWLVSLWYQLILLRNIGDALQAGFGIKLEKFPFGDINIFLEFLKGELRLNQW